MRRRPKDWDTAWACFCPENEVFITTVARTRRESIDLYLKGDGSTGPENMHFWKGAYRFGIRCKQITIMWHP